MAASKLTALKKSPRKRAAGIPDGLISCLLRHPSTPHSFRGSYDRCPRYRLLRRNAYAIVRVDHQGPLPQRCTRREAGKRREHRAAVDAEAKRVVAGRLVALETARDHRALRSAAKVGGCAIRVDEDAAAVAIGAASGRWSVEAQAAVGRSADAVEQARVWLKAPTALPARVAHANEEEALVEATMLDARRPGGREEAARPVRSQ